VGEAKALRLREIIVKAWSSIVKDKTMNRVKMLA
jgi:hypothetical protein